MRRALLLLLLLHAKLHAQAFQSPYKPFQFYSPRTKSLRQLKSSASNDKLATLPIRTSAKQTNQAPLNRKPNFYWNDIETVRNALREFWENLGITSFPENLPPIPSEALLNHFERHDLRRVITKYGGREDLAADLGGVDIIPGKWKDSVSESLIVQELLQNASHGLRADLPPLSPQQKKAAKGSSNDKDARDQARWSYKNKEERRPINYWSLAQVIESLYEHLDQVRELQNRPPVWMPRPAEIREAGRVDLFHAIARFGGGKEIAQIAGLVSYNEWRYFEGQLELMRELMRYLDEHHGGDHMHFPTATEIKENDCMSLYYAVQRYGGLKFLASRFGMNMQGRTTNSYLDMSFGPFSLDFAILLLEYVRNDHLERKAPLKPAAIRMPTEYTLFQIGRSDLIDGIQKYGGYENVARRLGLAYFDASLCSTKGTIRRIR